MTSDFNDQNDINPEDITPDTNGNADHTNGDAGADVPDELSDFANLADFGDLAALADGLEGDASLMSALEDALGAEGEAAVEAGDVAGAELTATLADVIADIDSKATRATLPGAENTQRRAVGLDQRFVVFTLNNARYAVPIANVLEIQQLPEVTPIPNVPDWVDGVTNLRGEIISVIDLRSLLSIDRSSLNQSARLLVAKTEAEDLTTGIVVDSVVGIRHVTKDEIEATASMPDNAVARWLQGVATIDGHLVAVFDLERLLASDEVRQFEAV